MHEMVDFLRVLCSQVFRDRYRCAVAVGSTWASLVVKPVGVVCGESLGVGNVKPSCSGASGGCVLPLMRFGRGQLTRLSVVMTGKIWLSGSVVREVSGRGGSVVGVSRWSIPFQRGE